MWQPLFFTVSMKRLGLFPLTGAERQKRRRDKLKNKDEWSYWAFSAHYHHTTGDYRGKYKTNRQTKALFSKEELVLLAKNTQKCLYCGANLIYKRTWENKMTPYGASLDNRDLKSNLNITDVDIICYSCNRTKSNRTKEEFLAYCRNVLILNA